MPFIKPPLQEVYDLLKEQNSLIVHFSGSPKGQGVPRPNNAYPNDLEKVLNGSAVGGLSCSTVKPGDDLNYYSPFRKSFGHVGIVLGFLSEQSLITASTRDGGTSTNLNDSRADHDRDLSIAELEQSITARIDRHNEWAVRDYISIGVFMSPPPIMVDQFERTLGYDDMPDDMKKYADEYSVQSVQITEDHVIKEFAGKHRLFTFRGMEIHEWKDEGWSAVDHASIYEI
jgi:hypothetical protein